MAPKPPNSCTTAGVPSLKGKRGPIILYATNYEHHLNRKLAIKYLTGECVKNEDCVEACRSFLAVLISPSATYVLPKRYIPRNLKYRRSFRIASPPDYKRQKPAPRISGCRHSSLVLVSGEDAQNRAQTDAFSIVNRLRNPSANDRWRRMPGSIT